MSYYNYENIANIAGNVKPENLHLAIENAAGTFIYFVDFTNNKLLKKLDVSDGSVTTVETRINKNIARIFHDRTNGFLYVIDCEYDDTYSYIWKLDMSDDTVTETATVEGDVFDIWIYSNEVFIAFDFHRLGCFGGGNEAGGDVDTIEYIDITTTTGNAVDRDNLTVARHGCAGTSGLVYGFYGGGNDGAQSNVIDYIEIAKSSGNAIDKGDLSLAREDLAGVQGINYGFYGGGRKAGGAPIDNTIDYIDITTTSGNATDVGNLSLAREELGGSQGTTYGYYGGGFTGAYWDTIDYIDLSVLIQNATDKGNLTVARRSINSCTGSSANFGFYAGGQNNIPAKVDIIDYHDITTTIGNALDKGDLTVARASVGAVSGPYLGYFGGGVNAAPALVNIIDYIDSTSGAGNALDKGDLGAARNLSGGVN